MNYLTLEQIQHEELNLLIALTTFLEENGLKYSLHSGTLLGAVRHGGFIPWDDDVDISMPRPDYERFLSRCAELPNNLFVINSDNSEFPYRFTKVCTRDVRAQQDVYEKLSDGLRVALGPYQLRRVPSMACPRAKKNKPGYLKACYSINVWLTIACLTTKLRTVGSAK